MWWGGCRLSGGKSPKQTRFIPSRTELVQQILLGLLLRHRHPYARILSPWSASISYMPLKSTVRYPRRVYDRDASKSPIIHRSATYLVLGCFTFRSDRPRTPLISSFSEIIPLYTYEVSNDKRSNQESKFRMQTHGCLYCLQNYHQPIYLAILICRSYALGMSTFFSLFFLHLVDS